MRSCLKAYSRSPCLSEQRVACGSADNLLGRSRCKSALLTEEQGQVASMPLVEGLQGQRGAVAQASTPSGSLLQQFRSGLRHHEQGGLTDMCCDELNQVQQRLVGPVQVLEQEAQRLAAGQCFDEAAHRCMQRTLVSQRCRPLTVDIQSAKPRQVLSEFSGVPCDLGLTQHFCNQLTKFA